MGKLLQIACISIIIILMAISISGCAGILAAPNVTPTATVAPTPTPEPSVLVHGVVTVNGDPVENYQVSVTFPAVSGPAYVEARTGRDGSYAIRFDPGALRERSYSDVEIRNNHGSILYSDSSTHRIDNQPMDFPLVMN